MGPHGVGITAKALIELLLKDWEVPTNTLIYGSITLLLGRDVIRERLEVLTLCIGFDNLSADTGQIINLARHQLRQRFW